ncbi:MAG: lantibiotic dehydratase [Rhodobacter sp.]|nr:lantibiotic dehydratase [Rhodobacter sp.]
MKHADLQPHVALGWTASASFWMRSAGFPLAWLETCACPVDPQDEGALTDWFSTDLTVCQEAFVGLARDELVAEAIGLSNPDALDRVQRLSECDLGRINSRNRQRLRLYWMYMQRLCAKNDTCSFFGPMSWGRIAADGSGDCFEVIDTRPDADRRVFFEHWFVQRIADQIAADPQVQAALPVRLNSGVALTPDAVIVPVDRRVALKPGQIALLQDIARRQATEDPVIRADLPVSGFASKMLEKGVIVTDIVVPTVHKHPMDWLADRVGAFRVSPRLETWSARLGELAGICREAQTLTGAARAETLGRVGAMAQGWGVDLERKAGAMYVGRFPTYEDAQRKVDLTLSRTTADGITRDLAPLLSAYTCLVDRVAAALDDAYGEVLGSVAPDGSAGFLTFLKALSGAGDVVSAIVKRQRADLRQLWSTAEQFADSGLGGEQRGELCFAPVGLQAFFEQLPAPDRVIATLPWRNVHSPDIMVMARDADAVAAGDFSVVIGETHPGIYMVGQHVAAPFRPKDAGIEDDLGRILAGPTPVMCDPPETYQRSNVNLPDCADLLEITLPGQASRLDAGKVITAAGCQVEQGTTCIELVVPARSIRVPLLTAMAGHLHKALFALAGDLAGRSRRERLRVGRVVFQRRQWNFRTADLPKTERPGEAPECFAAIANWAETAGLPRFVFAVVPEEPKPIYVDFRNPLAVDALVKHCRKVPEFSLSEMLPARDDLLFADQRGAFTAEFRMSFIAGQDQT